MDLSIIIVNYNSLEFLKKCLQSIFTSFGYPVDKKPASYEIIIVDNGSDDGSIDYLKNRKNSSGPGNLRFINCRNNTGFSRASNTGAKAAAGDFLLFLNPDTELPPSGFSEVLAFFKESDCDGNTGVVGAKTVNPDGSLQYSCRSFPTLARQFYESYFLHRLFRSSKIFGAYFMTFWDHGKDRKVDWLSGSFMLIKKSVFEKIGCFDEDYFIYSEDTDICLRLNRKGFKNYYCSRYKIMHRDAAVASRNMALRESQVWISRRAYFLKNHSAAHAKAFSLLYFIYIINRIIVHALLSVIRKSSNNHRARLTDYIKALKLYFSK